MIPVSVTSMLVGSEPGATVIGFGAKGQIDRKIHEPTPPRALNARARYVQVGWSPGQVTGTEKDGAGWSTRSVVHWPTVLEQLLRHRWSS